MPINSSNSINTSGNGSIFELVNRTKRFIRFELVHAGFTCAIFFGIFLVLQPWNYSSGSSEDRPYWMVGLPLIYFMMDLALAVMLRFSMLNELRPRTCKLWMVLQVVNLIQLTLMGFFMIWQIEFGDYTYLKLMLAILVLYVYKFYRISIMKKLILDMNARCSITCMNGGGGIPNSNTSMSSNGLGHNSQQRDRKQPVPQPTGFMQQPEGASSPPLVGNVKYESSA